MTSIALEMVLPGVIGLWIDRQLGTVMVFLLLGMILGVTLGMIHLIRLATKAGEDKAADAPSTEADADRTKKDGKPDGT